MNEFDTFTLYEELLTKENFTELEDYIFSFLDEKYKSYNEMPNCQSAIWEVITVDTEFFLSHNVEKILVLMRKDKSSYVVERYLRDFYVSYIPISDWANWFLKEDKRVFRWPLNAAWKRVHLKYKHTFDTTDELYDFLMSKKGQKVLQESLSWKQYGERTLESNL